MVSENQAFTFFLLINYSFHCKISFDQNLLYFLETRVGVALTGTLDTGCLAMLLISGMALSKCFHCLHSPVSYL